MRILHITPDYYPAIGGGELYIKEISERLAAGGHEVTVLAMNSRGVSEPNGDDLPSKDIINQVQVYRLNNTYKRHRRLLAMRGAHRALGLALDDERMKLVAASPVSLRALLFTWRAHVDVVAVANWYHGSLAYQTAVVRDISDFALVGIPFFHTERPWAHSQVLAQVLDRCDAVAVLTEHEARFIQQRSAQRNVHVAGAGVEPALFANANGAEIRRRFGIGGAPLVGYVGRMSATKGVITLIQAMQIVWQSDASVRLILAGSGLPSSPTCDEDIRCALGNLSETERRRIVCLDSFSDADKASIFDALDVFAMVSVAESFGIAYLEAWMCRKAPIGSRIGSTACVIHDGVDGRLVTPDVPEDLAGCITGLLADRDARERMGRVGHAKSLASFTWDQVALNVEQAYHSARAAREKRTAKTRAMA